MNTDSQAKRISPTSTTAVCDAHLTYTTDSIDGIHRIRAGTRFQYKNAKGQLIRDPRILARIHQLVIPPAWSDVWICSVANGHLQATGRDARGRKQYLYHVRWRSIRDSNKFARLAYFGAALPAIRRKARRDLRRSGISREKVLAVVVRLLEESLIRVGNEEYARANKSFGLTTLKNHHVKVAGSSIRFQFRGKSGKTHSINVTDKRVAKIVKRCQELPGHDLFEYLDSDGEPHAVTSTQVNAYLHEIAGEEFTAKDFRTWAGTLAAAKRLVQCKAVTRTKLAAVVKDVAALLGNTPTVCRNCYIHPLVLSGGEQKTLSKLMKKCRLKKLSKSGLSSDETILLQFLKTAKALKAE